MTACKWDAAIDLPGFWELAKRVLKPSGAVISTASQPFTTDLINSNRGWFRFEMIWDKGRTTGFLDANRRPLKRHENVLVFSGSGGFTYKPIMRKGLLKKKGGSSEAAIYNNYKTVKSENDIYYPTSIIEFSNAAQAEKNHPTQKPVALFEYLIRTYSNPGDLVLDPFAGSGTTAVAAHNTARNFIAIEKDANYFQVAQRQIELAQAQLRFDVG